MSTAISQGIVLVVEDDPAAREFYRSILRQAGLAVVAVEDGLEALQIVETRPPEVVILDMALPRVSGRDVYHELKARPETRGIPIVVVTGHDISDLDPGDFAGVLQKPLDPNDLVSMVRACMPRIGRSVEPA